MKAVVTRADFTDGANLDSGTRNVLDNVMAREKALYDGHAVAAVAAISAAVAKQGAEADQGRL